MTKCTREDKERKRVLVVADELAMERKVVAEKTLLISFIVSRSALKGSSSLVLLTANITF
jgi:hypothetical protein